jgi:hypothetical protein
MGRTTTDHDVIRKWAEARDARPARVKGTGDDDAGLLRLDFGPPEEGLEPIGWEDFFATFDESGLAFVYDAAPESRFGKIVRR